MTKIRYLEASISEQNTPVAIVQIRRFSPLDVSFPSPGIYQGQVWVVLPSLDPTHITRFTNTRGVEPLVLIIENDKPIGAGDILRFIEKNSRALARQSKKFSQQIHHSPINDLLLTSYPAKAKNDRSIDRSDVRQPRYKGQSDESFVRGNGNPPEYDG